MEGIREPQFTNDLRQTRADTAYKVKPEISQMAQPVFHISAKHPQEKHVSQDVQEAAVQKHAGDERNDAPDRTRTGMSQRLFSAQREPGQIAVPGNLPSRGGKR